MNNHCRLSLASLKGIKKIIEEVFDSNDYKTCSKLVEELELEISRQEGILFHTLPPAIQEMICDLRKDRSCKISETPIRIIITKHGRNPLTVNNHNNAWVYDDEDNPVDFDLQNYADIEKIKEYLGIKPKESK